MCLQHSAAKELVISAKRVAQNSKKRPYRPLYLFLLGKVSQIIRSNRCKVLNSATMLWAFNWRAIGKRNLRLGTSRCDLPPTFCYGAAARAGRLWSQVQHYKGSRCGSKHFSLAPCKTNQPRCPKKLISKVRARIWPCTYHTQEPYDIQAASKISLHIDFPDESKGI